MRVHGVPIPAGIFPVLFLGIASATSLAASQYAITATNVTMPLSGLGSTQYTVTGIPMAGTLAVSCAYAGTDTNAKVPVCTYGPVRAPIDVTAGETVKGSIDFYPYGSAIPLGLHRRSHAPGAGLVLAGALLLGLGLRRRARGWLTLTAMAAGLAGVMGISACVGNLNGGTKGTFPYTLMAATSPLVGEGPTVGVSTTITVTVP
jgi:hypothetical protein